MIASRKLLLPQLILTAVADESEIDSVTVTDSIVPYSVKSSFIGKEGMRRDGKPVWAKHEFNLFPLVIDREGVPWAEAAVYILDKLESQVSPNMTTVSSLADDLNSYRRFLDECEIDWTHFPKQKFSRPTYRYNGHLKYMVTAGELSPLTAKRRMNTIINFYRWLANEHALIPENEPWKESDQYIHFKTSHGFLHSKKVLSTDLSMQAPRQNDPYGGTIDDGGKLRPLPLNEQKWLFEALGSIDNTEMSLIHLFSLLTGARLQTVLTFKVRHALTDLSDLDDNSNVRFCVGPGTGIDTKNDKRMVIHISVWFFKLLRTYALSNRAILRRQRSRNGDVDDQYLFLSQRGAPLYQSKAEVSEFDNSNHLRHMKLGQAVRQFIRERVIPFIRDKYDVANFHYRFHDLRATAGMNWTDQQLKLVEDGVITLHEAREYVKTRMCHESCVTTDKYLKFRHNLKIVRWAEAQHEGHLQDLANIAMKRVL